MSADLSDQTKTLPVSNWDSANEVIRLALQQFGIIVSKPGESSSTSWRNIVVGLFIFTDAVQAKDITVSPQQPKKTRRIEQKACFSHKPCSHEYPFSIQMSHVRNSAVQGGGRDIAAPPADRQMAMQMQVYKQCQFILKPRPVEPPQQHLPADFSQKSFKRRHSLITWAFWRGSSSHLNEMLLAGAARGCLFALIVTNLLPLPPQDMLMFLYHEGSWTRGIFRRSAGARAVKELRESLDAGQFQLPLTRDHVFIIAGVFKDFLRRIPGSLLGCDVYEEWLDVLEEEEEEEEQVQDIKRMIRRMSKENALLLRYLLAMLHAVQANAQENQMTSFNLSVCIAPSLLWSPGAPCSPEVEGEGTKKVCELVKFMIEHCVQILGEDPSSLFGGPPQRRNSEESGSESWVYPLTDSSYDSLENELDDSSGGSPGFCSRRPLRPKPLQSSLDSILTFSDYDQDTEPEVPLSKAEALLGVRLHSAERCKRKDIPAVEISPSLDSLSLEARHSQRRSSEPAIVYAAKFCPYMSGSTDGLSGEEEEVLAKRQSSYKSRGRTMRSGAALGTTSSSLSSTLSSPAHTRSSLDSLDSLSTNPTKPTHPPSSSALPAPAPSIISKDPLHRGAVKGCLGLHPNSWLKKDRRLSLTQLESLEKEEDDRTQGGAAEKGSTKLISNNQPKAKTSRRGSKDTGEKGNIRHPKQEPSSPSLLQRAAGSLRFSKPTRLQSPESALTVQISDMNTNPGGDITIKRCEAPEIKQQPLFYKHSGPSLSLFRRQKAPTVEDRNSRLYQRRGSEPERQVADRASTFTRVRLPSDPGLKLPDADQQGRFCLSPCATKAVRDYFSSHPRSNPQSTQQVALTLVEGQRGEWLKRCSDPTVEPDLEQLLFAEESYV
ncbi:hypothetical protein GOODEAATRI_000023 [Goodea atripinnis]|uniref:Rho-GAP domain-containing protein n=1 Tax=Goodea atripinnis TaxID=208336 RepID=A0ABV0PJL2_9TELE